MKNKWIKAALPVVVLAIGFATMSAIKATADQAEEKAEVDSRPVVEVESLVPQDYRVVITSFGEVKPLESTKLAAQVSGEVISWHPNFVAGGVVKKNDVLFSIEPDTYQAALLQAEATLSQAQAALVEEQARAKVAQDEAKKLPASKVTDLYLRIPQVLSAKAALKSAEAKFKIAQRDLANCEVRAPYNALVVTRNLGVGQFVNRGEAVGELNNIDSAEVILPIAGFDNAVLPKHLAGTPAQVHKKGNHSFTRHGHISRDLGIVDASTRMSQLVARISDPYSLSTDAPAIKFGSYVEVSFVGKTLQQVYPLPQELVTNKTVWVVNNKQQLQARQVEIIREEGAYFLISQGLQQDDKLVKTVPEYPQSGMDVKLAQTKLIAQRAKAEAKP